MFLLDTMFAIHIPACQRPFSRRRAAGGGEGDGLRSSSSGFGEIEIFFFVGLVGVIICAAPETVQVVVWVGGDVVYYGQEFVEMAEEEGLMV